MNGTHFIFLLKKQCTTCINPFCNSINRSLARARNAIAIQNNLTSETPFNIASLDQLFPSSIQLPDTEFIWLKLIESFEQHLPIFDQKGFTLYQDQWMQWDAFKETEVCISGAGKAPVFGIAKGVDSNGALLLEQETKTVAIHAGDVSLRARS